MLCKKINNNPLISVSSKHSTHSGLAHSPFIFCTTPVFAGKKKYSRDWDFEKSNLKRYLEGEKNKISIWDILSFSLQHTMAEIFEDTEKLKRGLVKVLECVATISSAAAVVNPIFGVAGSLIRVVLHHVDDEDIQKLRREFGSVNRVLDEISQRNRQALLQIRKETLDKQYHEVEEDIRNQFRKFMEIVEAKPENLQRKREDFVESFINDKDDQNMYTLYEGGKRKLFSLYLSII
ncbi:protein rapunzel-like isoform X1 [Siphateles boraxobius]|uniref:protein rapunzel-like isoform X1 n=1 Tax=Siphateles boraxobius TaxID=180520 RepID=UPI004063FD35